MAPIQRFIWSLRMCQGTYLGLKEAPISLCMYHVDTWTLWAGALGRGDVNGKGFPMRDGICVVCIGGQTRGPY